jgi:hypothetical protein
MTTSLGAAVCGALLAFTWALALAAAPVAARTVPVTSSADRGPGTLRAAIDAANRDAGISSIVVQDTTGAVIALARPLVYRGRQALTIDGAGRTVTDAGAGALLRATGGGDLSLADLAFVKARRSAVVVSVPAGGAPRVQRVTLERVTLQGNGHYGLLIDDQAGGDGRGADSPASVLLTVRDSTVTGNNAPDLAPDAADKDGIRIDEGGPGGVAVSISDTTFDANWAEGLEIDERGAGGVQLHVQRSSFTDNGRQPQAPDDLEDGLDVDEAGPGGLLVALTDVTVARNADEGLDLDAAGPGAVQLAALRLDAHANADDNLKLTLVQDGRGPAQGMTVGLDLGRLEASADGDGIKLEVLGPDGDPADEGAIAATLRGVRATGNASDDVQLEAAQGRLTIRGGEVGAVEVSDGIAVEEDD